MSTAISRRLQLGAGILCRRGPTLASAALLIPSPVARLLRLWIRGLAPRDWTLEDLWMDGA